MIGEYYTSNRVLTFTVENLRGYKLPSTGGSGVLPCVLIGLTLMIGPFVYGFSMRRRSERRSKN